MKMFFYEQIAVGSGGKILKKVQFIMQRTKLNFEQSYLHPSKEKVKKNIDFLGLEVIL